MRLVCLFFSVRLLLFLVSRSSFWWRCCVFWRAERVVVCGLSTRLFECEPDEERSPSRRALVGVTHTHRCDAFRLHFTDGGDLHTAIIAE